jgi:hypothetical protein
VAEDLVAGHGRIVAEFFDVDRSRRLPWSQRPRSAALLRLLADPARGFDAVVVGEYERAFYGDQVVTLLPVLVRSDQAAIPREHSRTRFTGGTGRAGGEVGAGQSYVRAAGIWLSAGVAR